MAKFKVGDRVKCICEVDGNHYVAGEIGTIVSVHNLTDTLKTYGVEFDKNIHGHDLSGKCKNYYGWWCKESDLVKVCDEKIVITTDGKTTTAKLYDGKIVVKTAISKCSPEDEFDFETGAKIAFDRLVKPKEKSFDWDAFKNDEFFVQVSADNYYSFVEEAKKHGCLFKNNENPNPFKDKNMMFNIRLVSKCVKKTGDFSAHIGTVLIGFTGVLGFTAHSVDNKPVHKW